MLALKLEILSRTKEYILILKRDQIQRLLKRQIAVEHANPDLFNSIVAVFNVVPVESKSSIKIIL